MGRHVDQVAAVGHQLGQPVAMLQRGLGRGRHLHQVNVHVQQAGMVPRARHGGEGVFQHRLRLQRRGAFGRLARRQVPQQPRRAVHQRLGEDRDDVQIVAVPAMDLAHRVGKRVVPRAEILDLRVGRVAARQRIDQVVLDGAERVAQSLGHFQRFMGPGQRLAPLVFGEELPRLVVVGANGIGEAPHRGARSRGLRQSPLRRPPPRLRGCSRKARSAHGRRPPAPWRSQWSRRACRGRGRNPVSWGHPPKSCRPVPALAGR